jgi:superfamily II DNA/RNA helicase
VLFSGSVPGDKRGALVQQFHQDPRCRLFLSTDAGGVGLNLQHAAAVVVNMDQPWNPAVLEQRIGRVHRMGQSRGVQVINFVGEGSIEEGMLSVLAFKKSLFAGVLDGGEVDIFMQGTRLAKFMESVEKVSERMGQSDAPTAAPSETECTATTEPGEASAPRANTAAVPAMATPISEVPQSSPRTDAVGAAAASPTADPWAAILEAGAALLQGLAAARGDAGSGAAPLAIERDPVSGQASIRVPLPDPSVLQRLAKAFEPWLK